MLLKYTELFLLLLLSVLSDSFTYKIKNIIVLPFLFLGFVTNLLLYRFSGATDSFLGVILPFALLILFYALRMLGAGDIKLFCGIGSIMGVVFLLNTLAYSFLFGGLLAMAIMLLRHNSKQRFLHLYKYIRVSFFTLSFMPYTIFENKSDGSKFHFSYAIILGVIFTVYLSYSTYRV